MKRYLGILAGVFLSLCSSFGQLITMQPLDEEVCASDTAHFSVSVVSNVSIQWYYTTDTVSIPWNIPSVGVSGVQTDMLNVLQPGMYSGAYFRVIVVDLAGLMPNDTSGIVSLTVYPNPAPVMVSDPMGFVFCEGNSITLQTMEMNPVYSYLWSTMEQTPSISVQSGGVYSVTVTDDHMCSGNTSTPLVIQHPKPTPEIVPNEDLAKFCPGKSLTLESDSVYVSYSWSSPPGGNNMFATVDAPGTYSLMVTDFNGCTSSVSRTVTLYPAASQPTILPIPMEFCQGDTLWLVSSSGYDVYEWNTGVKNDSLPVSAAGLYSLTVTDDNGCTATNTATPKENALPTAAFTTFPDNLMTNPVITGEEITFYDSSVDAGKAISTWTWNFGEDSTIPDTVYEEAGNITDIRYLEEGPKEVCLEVRDENQCEDKECKPFQVTSAGGPIINFVNIEEPFCFKDTFCVIAVVNIFELGTFLQPYLDWSFDESVLKLLSTEQSQQSQQSFTEEACFVFITPGDITVLAHALQTDINDPSDTISGYNSFVVSSGIEAPVIENEIFPTHLCKGESDIIELSVTPASNGTVEYSFDGGVSSILINYINGSINIPVQANGTEDTIHVLIQRIITNGCPSEPERLYSIEIRPLPLVSITGPDTVCVDEIAYLHANGDAMQFEWRINGVTPPTYTLDSVEIETDEPGTYTYSVNGRLNGCPSTDSTTVFVADTLSPQIYGDSVVCKDQVIEYSSGNSMPLHEWLITGGTILIQQNDEVYVEWSTPGQGSIQLTQNIGRCSGEAFITVTISNDNSPPLDSVEYLKGGRILVYPNPDLIPGLCYQWYKDGQAIVGDTFQGYVVPVGVPENQLSNYSVKVWFCDAGEACAQYISYRSESNSAITDEPEILVVPNPNNGQFELRYKGLQPGTYDQDIIELSGKLVNHDRLEFSEPQGIYSQFPKPLASGVYLIRWINTSLGTVHITQMIVLP